jgi:putative flippase GtrA
MGLPAALRRIDAPVVRQFVKYGIVGASNTIITLVLYSLFVEIGVQYLIALVFAYLVGSLNSYLLNRH